MDESPVPDFAKVFTQPATVQEILSGHEKSIETVREIFPTLDDARLMTNWSAMRDGKPVMTMPKVMFLRSIMLNHWIQHRGQLGVYLRLIGARCRPATAPAVTRGKRHAFRGDRPLNKGINLCSATSEIAIKFPKIVDQAQWKKASDAFLVKEKTATRERNALAAERRRLPMMKIDKKYVFTGPNGKMSLLDLFEGRRQLILYHFMFAPPVGGWPDAGCMGCSMVTDQFGHTGASPRPRYILLPGLARAA